MMSKFLKNRELLLVGAIAVLLALITWRFPPFVAPANLARVYNDTSILIILALGQMAVILTRCIDLSMAANLALSGMVAAMLNAAYPGLPIPIVILSAIALGTLLGMINGALVWKLDIPPIVVTLGTLTIYRGLIFLLSDGKWINAHQMSDAFKALPRDALLGFPVLSWLSLLMIALVFLLMSRTALGRAFYAVGGNPHAAVYTGIDVGRTRFAAYCLSGALAGLSGYLWVSRYAVAYVDIAAGFELDIIAACVIGGISIAGGIGTVAGAVLGALFLGVIKNALPVINISPFAQMAISGTVIIIAVAVNARAERRKGRVILRKAEAV
ncbi:MULTISPECIES: ABC transporter permease [unclassified Ensifer]|uniref:ABC transporter permease n=1 Tax=unclassified Ensifer TaxID=2633371 RepID=UPI00081349C9|nr:MULTISPECIES: ABC transporter permease [unclassified Ensifer]OCP04970.1 branched-chain amino acid ABC transporter permease [Ensifer sp. LC14]OCP11871.1 branched-chain amino acid ABC transporter permease [Ensifer sp. LC13]OCP12428.1 branched-chain amino acid ABC transporter permease [Ensifer sp. LC11]OCP33605.1 branched-chain amino acid ABC transporter permease [Ensifer sp. LC499]